jgi:hypothetical protein
MEPATLAEIKDEIDRRAAVVGASGNLLPTYGRTEDFARPHIEVDSRGYHYVVVERGNESERITTPHLDELLFHVFDMITFFLAGRYEVQHRRRKEDCRRQMFSHQIELLAKLTPAWAERTARHHQEVLQANPYEDWRF